MAQIRTTVIRASNSTASSHVPLPPATRVGGIRLQVSELAASVAYYRDVIGLHVIELSANTATLGAPASPEPLVTLHWVPGTRPARRRGTFGLFHFAILLPNREALGRFVAHLASKGVYAGMSDHKVSEAVYLSDPDGLGIEVYADRPRSGWRDVNGQLVMTTDPLDVDDLVGAGAGQQWDGVPAGTTIGHVHLHVGDLDQAAAFYQGMLGFDITVWNYPGALFFAAGGYHHHLGTNVWAPGPAPAPDQARLLEWTLVVPSPADVQVVGQRLRDSGAPAVADSQDWLVADGWGTRVRVTSE
jgi:catechol 2,3-dioxygenase